MMSCVRVMAWVPLLSLVLCTACGGAPKAARTALSITAVAVVRTDEVVAIRYTAAANSALSSATSLEDYRDRMAGWDTVERALRGSRAALLIAQSALDTWDDAGEGQWLGAAACLSASLRGIHAAIIALAITVPDELLAALEIAGTFSGECHVD